MRCADMGTWGRELVPNELNKKYIMTEKDVKLVWGMC